MAFFGNKDEALLYFKGFHPQHMGQPSEAKGEMQLEPDLLLDTVEQPLQDLQTGPVSTYGVMLLSFGRKGTNSTELIPPEV